MMTNHPSNSIKEDGMHTYSALTLVFSLTRNIFMKDSFFKIKGSLNLTIVELTLHKKANTLENSRTESLMVKESIPSSQMINHQKNILPIKDNGKMECW